MSWLVVIPFKGAPASKSRLAARYDDAQRAALAVAMLRDTIAAVRAVPAVTGVAVVSSDDSLDRLIGAAESLAPESPLAPVEVVADPGSGLNEAVAHGLARLRVTDASCHVAALLGDLPGLRADELGEALELAAKHPQAFVPDRNGTGTTLITLAPGVEAAPLFGAGSAAAHETAGFVPIEVQERSGLRADVDAPEDLDALADVVGQFTGRLLSRI